jgi:mitochondrial import inner membrane translocase subunit TIM23
MPGIWELMTGRKPSPAPKHADQDHTSPLHPQPVGLSQPSRATSYTDFDPTEGQGTDAFLKPSAFADPGALYPLAGVNEETLEYLSLDDTALAEGHTVMPSRGFFDDLCYGTGVTYVTTLGIGGAWGLQEGLRKSAGQPPKLRLNSALNAVTRRGPFLGNSCAVIALGYNFVNAYLGYLRGKDDAANAIAAGVLTGMAFKSTRGLRPMMISGGIVGSVAALWAVSWFSPLSWTGTAPCRGCGPEHGGMEANSAVLGWEGSIFTSTARKRSQARVELAMMVASHGNGALLERVYSPHDGVISAPLDSCKLDGYRDRMHGLDMALRTSHFMHCLAMKVMKTIITLLPHILGSHFSFYALAKGVVEPFGDDSFPLPTRFNNKRRISAGRCHQVSTEAHSTFHARH